jgi:hypothetical protein
MMVTRRLDLENLLAEAGPDESGSVPFSTE